jgi:hypothetical protein
MVTGEAILPSRNGKTWITGNVNSPIGNIPQVATQLNFYDLLGTIKVRTGIQRMHYLVEPGLYAIGTPTAESPVFVSANYKLSFDNLRREVEGINGWIMVIDTKGVNVWCAAGKGTFGTEEIIHRIEATRLAEVVSHRQIIVPQLGAPGVAAQEVKNRSSFRVIYGPVRASDLREFLGAGMKASPPMRQVHFNLKDRAALIPVDFFQGASFIVGAALLFFLLEGISRNGYNFPGWTGGREALIIFLGFFTGIVLTPLLLPWLPGRALSIKGMTLGLAMALTLVLTGLIPFAQAAGHLEAVGWFLLIPAVSAFTAMNFTGSTTYTSLSGVKLEMRYAVPAQIAAAVLGSCFWIAARFF